jgi:hypothetical protein
MSQDAGVALHLYRRHRRDCKAGRVEDSLNSEFDERKKGWKRCECPITASGTLAKKYRRQSTGAWEWESARVVVEGWERSGIWGKITSLPQTVVQLPIADDRTTILVASQAFLDRATAKEFEPATESKYRTFIKQLHSFTDGKGYLYFDQLTITDMDRFFASWSDGKRAKARKLHKLTGFVEFCVKRKWLKEDITADLEPPEGHSIPTNKSPFTDDEINRIPAACDKIGGARAPGPACREWTGNLTVQARQVQDNASVRLFRKMKGVWTDSSNRNRNRFHCSGANGPRSSQ